MWGCQAFKNNKEETQPNYVTAIDKADTLQGFFDSEDSANVDWILQALEKVLVRFCAKKG